MHKVKLLGKLGQEFGREHTLDISSPAEAIRALCAIKEGFFERLRTSEESGVGYRVVTSDPMGTGVGELHFGLESNEQLVIAPIYSGKGTTGKILLGVALLAGSFFMPAAIPVFAGLAISSTAVGLLGASLILGGVSKLLTPTPSTPKSDAEREGSYLFDSAAETSFQGRPVPVGYGTKIITDLAVISSAVLTEDIPLDD